MTENKLSNGLIYLTLAVMALVMLVMIYVFVSTQVHQTRLLLQLNAVIENGIEGQDEVLDQRDNATSSMKMGFAEKRIRYIFEVKGGIYEANTRAFDDFSTKKIPILYVATKPKISAPGTYSQITANAAIVRREVLFWVLVDIILFTSVLLVFYRNK